MHLPPSPPPMLHWAWLPFEALTLAQLHALLALRQQVFVVEQRCAYLDADGLDPSCVHGLGTDEAGRLLATARIVPPGKKYAEPAIGRVAVAPEARGRGLGYALMDEAIAAARQRYPGRVIRLSAQAYLEAFYARLGFVRQGENYEEDGIPHLAMLLRPL